MTPCRPFNNLRTVLFIVVCLSLICPLATRASSPRRGASTPPRQEGEPPAEGRDLKRPGGFKRFGKNFLDFLKCRRSNVSALRELLEYGPEFPHRYDESDFSFKAVVKASWPMSVEYELEQQGVAVITIQVMGAPTFTQRLTGEGIGKRQTVRFTLPDYTERGLQAALISFKATRPGQRVEERAELQVFGVGAGDVAVASRTGGPDGVEFAALGPLPYGAGRTARPAPGRPFYGALNLSDVRLEPGPGGYVYSFKVNGRFNRWSAVILKLVPRLNHKESVELLTLALKGQPIDARRPVSRIWDGRNKGKKVGRGEYGVRAMVSVSTTGDWTFTKASLPILIN